MTVTEPLLTLAQVQARLGISRSMVYKLMAEDSLPAYKVTGKRGRFFKASDVDQLAVPKRAE